MPNCGRTSIECPDHRRVRTSVLSLLTSPFPGSSSPPWLSVYGATKAAVVGFSKSTQKELIGTGVSVTALCPGFVATDMTEFAQQSVPADQMMQPEDMAEAVSFLLKVSPACAVPELIMARPVAGPDTQGM